MLEHIAETWDRIAANIDEQRYLPEEIDFDKEAAN